MAKSSENEKRKFLEGQIERIDKSIDRRMAVIEDQRQMRQRFIDELKNLPKE